MRRATLTGIVLAGGNSVRMGRDKATLPFGGTPLISWVINRIAPICHEVFVVASEERIPPSGAPTIGEPEAQPISGPSVTVITDRRPGLGPLSGLATGLQATASPYAAVIACDVPFVSTAVLAGLAARANGWDAVVPAVRGRAQPLYAVYRREVGPVADALLREGKRALHDLLAVKTLRVCYVDDESLRVWDPLLDSFANINTPEHYEQAKARLAESALGPRRR